MAGSSALPENRYHARSISLPSRSHPSALKIKAVLNTLKARETSSTSAASSLKVETIQIGLAGLVELYNVIEDLIHSPLTQQALVHHQHQKWVDEVLDGSVRLLDECSTTRDLLSTMKERVQDLQSALRRGGGKSSMENNVTAYICFTKMVKKDVSKCIGALKRMDNKSRSSPLLDVEEHHMLTVVGVLREVRTITISIFRSLLLFLSMPISKTKSSKWLLVKKLVHRSSIACEVELNHTNEVEMVDVALCAFCANISNKDAKVDVQMAQKRLKKLEVSIEGLEDGLDCMFRCLIQNRVSLLNICTP